MLIYVFSSYKRAKIDLSSNLLLTTSEIVNNSIISGGLDTTILSSSALRHQVEESGTLFVAVNEDIFSHYF